MVLFILLSLYFVLSGVRQFDCRFFVPAQFAVSSVLMIVQGVLFFREWDGMTTYQLVSFDLACILTVVSGIFVLFALFRGGQAWFSYKDPVVRSGKFFWALTAFYVFSYVASLTLFC